MNIFYSIYSILPIFSEMYNNSPQLTSKPLVGSLAFYSRPFTICKFMPPFVISPIPILNPVLQLGQFCVSLLIHLSYLGMVFFLFFLLLFQESSLTVSTFPTSSFLEFQQHFSYISFILNSSLSASDRYVITMKTIT